MQDATLSAVELQLGAEFECVLSKGLDTAKKPNERTYAQGVASRSNSPQERISSVAAANGLLPVPWTPS